MNTQLALRDTGAKTHSKFTDGFQNYRGNFGSLNGFLGRYTPMPQSYGKNVVVTSSADDGRLLKEVKAFKLEVVDLMKDLTASISTDVGVSNLGKFLEAINLTSVENADKMIEFERWKIEEQRAHDATEKRKAEQQKEIDKRAAEKKAIDDQNKKEKLEANKNRHGLFKMGWGFLKEISPFFSGVDKAFKTGKEIYETHKRDKGYIKDAETGEWRLAGSKEYKGGETTALVGNFLADLSPFAKSTKETLEKTKEIADMTSKAFLLPAPNVKENTERYNPETGLWENENSVSVTNAVGREEVKKLTNTLQDLSDNVENMEGGGGKKKGLLGTLAQIRLLTMMTPALTAGVAAILPAIGAVAASITPAIVAGLGALLPAIAGVAALFAGFKIGEWLNTEYGFDEKISNFFMYLDEEARKAVAKGNKSAATIDERVGWANEEISNVQMARAQAGNAMSPDEIKKLREETYKKWDIDNGQLEAWNNKKKFEDELWEESGWGWFKYKAGQKYDSIFKNSKSQRDEDAHILADTDIRAKRAKRALENETIKKAEFEKSAKSQTPPNITINNAPTQVNGGSNNATSVKVIKTRNGKPSYNEVLKSNKAGFAAG